MSDIDLDDIRRIDGGLLLVFRELCRGRRTTTAANRLGLSQSAVSHALGRLRDIFGDPLFLRRPHGLEPTRRALELAPRVDALIDLIGAAVRSEMAFDPATSGRRFIVAGTEFAVGLIDGALVQRVHCAAPNASFVFTQGRGYIVLDALRRGEIDLALGRFETPPAGLVGEILFEDGYCVVARKGHPDIRGEIDPHQWRMTGHVFVATWEGSPGPDIGEDPLPSPVDVVTIALVPRMEMALAMVAGSDAIATCSRRLAEQQADVLGLQVLDLPYPGPAFTVSAARRAEADPGLDWFRSQIRLAASLRGAPP